MSRTHQILSFCWSNIFIIILSGRVKLILFSMSTVGLNNPYMFLENGKGKLIYKQKLYSFMNAYIPYIVFVIPSLEKEWNLF